MCGPDPGSWCDPNLGLTTLVIAGVVILLTVVIAVVIRRCIKHGVRQAFATMRADLGPQRRHRRQEDPDTGNDLAKEAQSSAAGDAQEARVTIALHGAARAARYRQQRRDAAQEMRNRRVGEVVEQGESRVRVYADSPETAEAAAQVARE